MKVDSSTTWKSKKIRNCIRCGRTFKSYNPNPKYCSRACKDADQIAQVDEGEAIRLYQSGMTQVEVAEEMGVTQKVIYNVLRRNHVSTRPQVKRNQWRENNAYWRGGRHVNASGYVMRYRPEHPRAGRNGYVQEHVLVLEQKLGRHLMWKGPGHPESEIVHHINGDKRDNRPGNLQLTSFVEHLKLHRDPALGRNEDGGDAECR